MEHEKLEISREKNQEIYNVDLLSQIYSLYCKEFFLMSFKTILYRKLFKI